MQKTKTPAVVATFVVCYAFWILLTWSFAAQELIVGAVVSLLVALFAARFFISVHIHSCKAWMSASETLCHMEPPTIGFG